MTTEQILSHIREVCGLKRLEFGCEFERKNKNTIGIQESKMFIVANHTFHVSQSIQTYTGSISIQSDNREKASGYYWVYDGEVFCRKVSFEEFGDIYEIIGLPIYLEHLLYAMKLTGHNWESITVKENIIKFAIPKEEITRTTDEDTGEVYEEFHWYQTEYDLTRTVEQNLTENTELRELIISLIK